MKLWVLRRVMARYELKLGGVDSSTAVLLSYAQLQELRADIDTLLTQDAPSAGVEVSRASHYS